MLKLCWSYAEIMLKLCSNHAQIMLYNLPSVADDQEGISVVNSFAVMLVFQDVAFCALTIIAGLEVSARLGTKARGVAFIKILTNSTVCSIKNFTVWACTKGTLWGLNATIWASIPKKKFKNQGLPNFSSKYLWVKLFLKKFWLLR